MFDLFCFKLLEFFCTYFLHSSALLVCAYLLKRSGALKNRAVAETIWRFAFWGGFVSATALSLLSNEKPSPSLKSTMETGSPTKTLERTPPTNTLTSLPQSESKQELAVRKKSEDEIPPSPVELASSINASHLQAAKTISLSAEIKPYLGYLAYGWLVFLVLSLTQFALRIVRLNQQVHRYPLCQLDFLSQLVERKFPQFKDRLTIRCSETWSSPIVTPNKVICLPDWTLRELAPKQLEMMVAHEVAHIQRDDPVLSIAYRFLTTAFFFQPMNIIAERELNSLAELACDALASESSIEKHHLAEALFACAKAKKRSNEIPKLALAMAKANSPLVTRVRVLIDEMPTIPMQHAKLIYFSSATVILMLILSVPSVRFTFTELRNLPAIASVNKITPLIDAIGQQLTAVKELNSSQPEAIPEKQATDLASLNNTSEAVVAAPANAVQSAPINEPGMPTTSSELQGTQASPQWTIEDAKQALNSKRLSDAYEILLTLAKADDTKAQSLLGTMYWNGEGRPIDLEEAEKWFRLAANKGDQAALQSVRLIDERRQKKRSIEFYTGESKSADYRYLEDKCPAPTYSNSLFASNAKALESWNKCAKKHLNALRAAKAQDQIIIPSALIPLLTDRELKMAEDNSSLVIEHAIESIAVSEAEMRRGLQTWNDAHPNLITNSAYIPAAKLPESTDRTPEYRVAVPPMQLKQSSP